MDVSLTINIWKHSSYECFLCLGSGLLPKHSWYNYTVYFAV